MDSSPRKPNLGRLVLFLPFVLVACETKGQDKPAAPGSSAAVSALPSASVVHVDEKNASGVGTFEGRYEAKRGEVEIPPKVKDKVRGNDDGKVAVGAGKISVTIGADGVILGKVEGALGAASLAGGVEGEDIRAAFTPDDVLSARAMFGFLDGKLSGDHLKGRIRVSNGDASVVREADIDLKKK